MRISLLLMSALAAAPYLSAQTCADERPFSPLYDGAGVFGETETQLHCTTTIIPKGRRFAALIYRVRYEDIADSPKPQGIFATTLRVTSGSATLLNELAGVVIDSSYFGTAGTPFTTPNGKPGLRYVKRVEKIVDVTALAASADVPVSIWSAALNQTVPPEGCTLTLTCQTPDSVNIDARLYADIRFVLNESPQSFVPRDSRDTESASQCTTLRSMCWPEYAARILYKPGELEPTENWEKLRGRIRFNLNRITRLKGNSSNSDLPASRAIDDDYAIDPALNVTGAGPGATPRFEPPAINRGQNFTNIIVRTADNQLSSANLTVSSLDYGGVAQLAAAFIAGGGVESVIDAEIVKADDGTAKPAATYASLPVDDDHNDIADAWEDAELGIGNRTNPDADTDPGSIAASPVGDGIAALDEYRGFHHIERNNSTRITKWSRLKPKIQDVFFHDTDGERFGDALWDLLGPRTGALITYREVTADQGNIGGASPFGRIGRNVQTRLEAHTVVFQAAALPSGILGRAARGRKNEGIPIDIDVAQIATTVARWRWCAPPSCDQAAEILLAVVLAHETGHQFGQIHPILNSSYQANVTPSTAPMLQPRTEYGLLGPPPSSGILMRLDIYQDLTGATNVGDNVVAERNRTSRRLEGHSVISGLGSQFPAIAATVPRPALSPGVDVVFVNHQEQRVMDWAIRATMNNLALWDFSPRHTRNFCVHKQCRALIVP